MTHNININGTSREMTAAEIAAMQQHQTSDSPESLDTDKKLELLLASIHEEPMPDTAPKLGYKWQATYTPSSGFAWELVEDPTALGTHQNPRYWVPGMTVQTGRYYTPDGKSLYLALKDCVTKALENAEAFERM